MKKNNAPDEDQQWFQQHIGAQLEKLDVAYEPIMPPLENVEAFVTTHKRELRRKMWKDLTILWMVAMFFFFGMMWVLENNWMWFLALQAFVAVGPLVFLYTSYRKKGVRIWKNS